MLKGRPTDYTPEIGLRICEAIATSANSMESICNSNEDFPNKSNAFKWMHRFEDFRANYLAAKETQAIMLTEGLLSSAIACPAISEEIAKQSHIFRVMQWHNSKLAPKQFGDKKHLTQEMNVNVHEQDLQKLK